MSSQFESRSRVLGPKFIAASVASTLGVVLAGAYLVTQGREIGAVLSTAADLGVLVVAILALWFTGAQLEASRTANLLASETQRQAAEQAERDSRASVRPYIFAELVPGLWGTDSCDLRIQNFGKTPARNLVIDASSWPEGDEEFSTKLRKFCQTPRTVPPGASHRLIWHADGLTEGDAFDKGERVTITLTYGDDNGGRWSEDYQIEIAMMQVEPAPNQGSENVGQGTVKILKDINHALRAMNVHIGSSRR